MTERRIDIITIGHPRIREDAGDLSELAASIERLGVLQPVVVTPNNELICGFRRLMACKQAGLTRVPVRVLCLSEAERILAEVEENQQRKSFTPSEAVKAKRQIEPALRALAQARMRAGRPYADSAQGPKGTTRRQVAAVIHGYGHDRFDKAEAVVEAAETEPERFGELLADMDSTGKVDRAFKRLRIEQARQNYNQHRQRGGKVSDLTALAATGYRAAAILADPPWPWMTYSESGKVKSCCENHYNSMSFDDIKRLPFTSLAAADSTLFLWATWPWLPQIIEVISAWKFTYKTAAFVWVKQNRNGEGLFTGMGYHTRSNTEVCLLATRGNPLRLASDVHQVIEAPVSRHSAKPNEVHARIERLVAGPYLELFARKARPGWSVWGDELPAAFGDKADM